MIDMTQLDQTAVDWLIEMITDLDRKRLQGTMSNSQYFIMREVAFAKARERMYNCLNHAWGTGHAAGLQDKDVPVVEYWQSFDEYYDDRYSPKEDGNGQ